ncbi:MAG: winged helix-turn-helix domain-containing protein [Rhizobiales bacterium]|nr:winged helix-turn-helix domain-containing protein [Hyphomicrobiales bacterium]
MKPPKGKFWAIDEDDAVRRLYPIGGAEAVHEVLPHRTLGAIRNRASVLGLPARNPVGMAWNTETIKRIVSMISRNPRPTNAEIAAEMGVSVTALATLLSRRGISNSHGAEARRAGRLAVQMQPCICCRVPFRPESRVNRLCQRCNSEISQMAA